MEFLACTKGDKIECRLLDDARKTLFHLRVPENTIEYWKVGINKWAKERPEGLARLVSLSDRMVECRSPDENEEKEELTRITFLKVLGALACVLRPLPGNENSPLLAVIQRILVSNQDFNLQIQPASTMFMFQVNHVAPAFFPIRLPIEEWSEEGAFEWWRYWHLALYQWPVEFPLSILPNLDLLDEIVYHRTHASNSAVSASFWMQGYASLLKALIKFLEETQDVQLIPFRRKSIPILCALLIKNEEVDIEEQKLYLERIFASNEMGIDAKNDLLADIVHNLKEDAGKNCQPTPRLSAVASAMTQYYLGRYDIFHTIELWTFAGDKDDLLLQGILAFYKKPHLYALTALILTLMTLLMSLWPDQNLLLQAGSFVSALLSGCILLLGIFGGVIAVSRLLRKQGLDYIELFFPRLLGAIVVGLSILIFESTVWDITLNLSWGNWLLLCLAAYAGSFLYFFVDIHKTTRLLPLPTEKNNGERNKLEPANAPAVRSLRTTWRIFWIGLFEAFTASLLISGFLGYAVISEHFIAMAKYQFLQWPSVFAFRTLLNSSDLTVYVWQLGASTIFVCLPKLVLLWTGLSLLIGAFAQLLWQDRQITAT